MKRIALVLLIIALIAFSFLLRKNAFQLSHWRGDQNHYVTLAMKLDKHGFSDYNLRGTRVLTVRVPQSQFLQLSMVDDSNAGQEGDILKTLRLVGQAYYNEPLHMRAPLFPLMLMLSHRWFAEPNQPYIVSSTPNMTDFSLLSNIEKKALFQTQFWAAIVPLFFNLATILLAFFLGWKLFNSKTIGFYSGLILCLNPLSIWLSHKLLNEDTAVFFVTLSLLTFFYFYHKKNGIGVCLSGVFGGLAVLTNQRMGLILIVVGVYCLYQNYLMLRAKGISVRGLTRFVLDPWIIAYTLCLFATSGYWFYLVWKEYGHPLHMPGTEMVDAVKTDVTGWFTAVMDRPHVVVLFSLGVISISPLFALIVLSLKRTFKALFFSYDLPKNYSALFLWLWVLVFYMYVAKPWGLDDSPTKEHRYMYAAYPALSALAAYGLYRLQQWFSKMFRNPMYGCLLVLVLFSLYASQTIPYAMKMIFSESLLF